MLPKLDKDSLSLIDSGSEKPGGGANTGTDGSTAVLLCLLSLSLCFEEDLGLATSCFEVTMLLTSPRLLTCWLIRAKLSLMLLCSLTLLLCGNVWLLYFELPDLLCEADFVVRGGEPEVTEDAEVGMSKMACNLGCSIRFMETKFLPESSSSDLKTQDFSEPDSLLLSHLMVEVGVAVSTGR